MIKLFILDTEYGVDKMQRDKGYEEKLISKLPISWKKRIESTKSEDVRRNRICAYLLLREMIKENYDFLFPGIKDTYGDDVNSYCDSTGLTFSKSGRPSFLNIDVDFSISHTNGAVVIAVSFNGKEKVGVDVEEVSQKNEDAAKRFISRYMKNGEIKSGDLLFTFDFYDDREVAVYKLKENGCEKVSNLTLTEDTVTKETHLRQWTSTEALLKCDGGGFSSLPRINDVRRKNAVDNGIVIIHGQKYSISVAHSIEITPMIV